MGGGAPTEKERMETRCDPAPVAAVMPTYAAPSSEVTAPRIENGRERRGLRRSSMKMDKRPDGIVRRDSARVVPTRDSS